MHAPVPNTHATNPLLSTMVLSNIFVLPSIILVPNTNYMLSNSKYRTPNTKYNLAKVPNACPKIPVVFEGGGRDSRNRQTSASHPFNLSTG